MSCCPNCGCNLATSVDWDALHRKRPTVNDEFVWWEFECPKCGKKFEDVYRYVGIFDPQRGEYIWQP